MSLSVRSISRAALAAAIASLLAFTACSDNSESPSPSPSASSPSAGSSPSSTIIPSSDLSGITVADGANGAPTVTVAAPWGIDKTQTKVLKEGGSQVLTETSKVTVNYVGVSGTSGQEFDNSWTNGAPQTFDLGGGMIQGFVDGLVGQKVGSRVLIGIAPADGYPEGNSQAGIAVGDSLIFVVDILSANVDEIAGEEVTPAAGLPAVTMTDSGPEIKIPDGSTAPSELVVQPLIKGPGAAIKESSSIEVRYRAWNYADGSLVKDAWVNQTGVLSNMIPGWRQGLVGQTTGSRVMLIVPPALAYPNGLSDGSLEPGQTLVYVIDIYNVMG